MKVSPICFTDQPRNHLRPAFMIVHHKAYTVMNVDTKERFTLPEKEAWQLYDKINEVV